eukprot:5005733-Pleurochrysis_carterae.AAC.1
MGKTWWDRWCEQQGAKVESNSGMATKRKNKANARTRGTKQKNRSETDCERGFEQERAAARTSGSEN